MIPTGPEMRHVGEKPVDEITWLIFPGSKPESFTLYCDDGDSLLYREGAYASVTLNCVPSKDGFTLKWEKIEGGEPLRISQLRHRFEILGAGKGLKAETEGKSIPVEYDAERNRCLLGPIKTGLEVNISRLA